MNSNNSIRNWFDLRGLPVIVSGEGLSIGTVEDFYYQAGTNAIAGLRIKTRLWGFKILTPNVISSIDRNAITITSQEMVIDESNGGDITEYPLGNDLLDYTVISEGGSTLGKIESILLATYPPVALRISAFQLTAGKTFSAMEVTTFGRNELTILDKAAKRL